MSISIELKASARAAYRQLYRAASSTFSGDTPVLQAFRLKMREDAVAARTVTDPATYAEYAKHANDVATFLRRNIVQASRVTDPRDHERDTWKIRITKDTELGSNDTIKNPDLMSIGGATNPEPAVPLDGVPAPRRPMHYSALKRAHSQRKLPELNEGDLEESFVRGSGPGGQSVNKTENNVQLLHKPTGIRVSCQESRSLALNRRLARRLVLEKLDQILNPGLSKEEMKRAKQRERERRRRRKARKKENNKAMSEQDDVDE